MDGDSSMIVEAKTIDGVVDVKHEIELECSNCGMVVDAVEYTKKICSDCGEPWEAKQHVDIHVTSVPATGISTL